MCAFSNSKSCPIVEKNAFKNGNKRHDSRHDSISFQIMTLKIDKNRISISDVCDLDLESFETKVNKVRLLDAGNDSTKFVMI